MSRRLRAFLLVGAMLGSALGSTALRGQSSAASFARCRASEGDDHLIGSVVDASLTPLSGVLVTLEREGHGIAKATTPADGTFRFPGLAAGTYRIRAERAGFPTVDREVRVTAGAEIVRMPIVLVKPEDLKAEAQSATMAEASRPMDAQRRTQGGVPPPPASTAPPPAGLPARP